jgi:hypothetical protein
MPHLLHRSIRSLALSYATQAQPDSAHLTHDLGVGTDRGLLALDKSGVVNPVSNT